MTLVEKISAELQSAMKARNEKLLSALRMLKAEFQRAQADKGMKEALTDEEALALVRRLVKQRREAAEQFKAGGAEDRANEELEEASLLEKYLPSQLSDEELDRIVEDVIALTGASSLKDIGKVMGPVMARAKGRADGTRVRSCVESRLKS
jgi:uncharacterized protein YqeY